MFSDLAVCVFQESGDHIDDCPGTRPASIPEARVSDTGVNSLFDKNDEVASERWTIEAKFIDPEGASTIPIRRMSLESCTIAVLVSTLCVITGNKMDEYHCTYIACDDLHTSITTDMELREAFRNTRQDILQICVQHQRTSTPSQPSSQILPRTDSEYVSIRARGHVLTFDEKTIECPGQEFNTGAYTIPFKTIDMHRVLNLADLFFPASGGKQIWDYGSTHAERVTQFFAIPDHWQYVLQHDYFMVPIDKSKLRRWQVTQSQQSKQTDTHPANRGRGRRSGRGGRTIARIQKPKMDVPNLTLASFSYLLNHFPRDVINIDPRSSLCDGSVRATNLSVVARHITATITPSTLTGKINIGPGADSTMPGTEYINYQRGTGTPSRTEYQQLHRILPGLNILQVRLIPGKYNHEGFPVTCYEGFGESVAQLANQFTDLPIYCKFEELKRQKTQQNLLNACHDIPPVFPVAGAPTTVAGVLPRLRALYLVLDEFSGYAMYYAAILKGFGLEHVTHVLCYTNGKYEDTSLLHRA